MISEYLTEKNVGVFLENRLETNSIILHNKKFPNSSINFRPDYRIDELNLVVEFEGYYHYNTYNIQLKDSLKLVKLIESGYRVIKIPYFIQFNSTIAVESIFSELISNTLPFNNYPHGFIDKKALRVCDFNYFGVKRFLNDLKIFSFAKEDILKTLTSNEITMLTVFESVISKDEIKLQ